MRQAVRAIVVREGHLLVMHRNKFGEQYYAVPGGAVKPGESQGQALQRELTEETSISVTNPRLVIVEDAGPMFGTQYIYLCDYAAGEPALAPYSEEAKISAMGTNLYTPQWLPVKNLPQAKLQPVELKEAVIAGLSRGFPEQPVQLTIRS